MLWNTVIIPVIEYQLQAVVLSEEVCKQIMSKVHKLIKHSCGLSISCPNALVEDKDIMNVKTFRSVSKKYFIL